MQALQRHAYSFNSIALLLFRNFLSLSNFHAPFYNSSPQLAVHFEHMLHCEIGSFRVILLHPTVTSLFWYEILQWNHQHEVLTVKQKKKLVLGELILSNGWVREWFSVKYILLTWHIYLYIGRCQCKNYLVNFYQN